MSNSIVFKSMFEQQIMNKCSSYIDSNKQLNMIMEQSNMQKDQQQQQQQHKSKKNMKKIRTLISNKLRKLINPSEFNISKETKSKNNSIQLVKFNYKSNFVNLQNSSRTEQIRRQNEISTQPRYSHLITPTLHAKNSTRRLSNGSSCSSRSSLHSNNSDELFLIQSNCNNMFDTDLFQSSQISHLFPNSEQNETNIDLSNNLIETSTPLTSSRILKRKIDESSGLISKYLFNESEQETCYVDTETVEENNLACYLDQSTQCQVDSPVLIESTFNHSSLSNLSDDLIILQTAYVPIVPVQASKSSTRNSCSNKKKKTKNDWNNLVIDEYHNDTNVVFDHLPQWAMGQNLNLALVNQLYYNPTGNGVFNQNKHSVPSESDYENSFLN